MAAVAVGVFHDAFESVGSVEALVVVEAFEAVESRVEQGLLIPLQYTCWQTVREEEVSMLQALESFESSMLQATVEASEAVVSEAVVASEGFDPSLAGLLLGYQYTGLQIERGEEEEWSPLLWPL